MRPTPHLKNRKMKATVSNYLNIQDSKRFRKMVANLMPYSVKHVCIDHYQMNSRSGWGHYERELHLIIDGVDVVIKHGTTNSIEWDAYHDLEYGSRAFDNAVKALVLDTIERNIDVIESHLETEEA
jgi:hypothetical protein